MCRCEAEAQERVASEILHHSVTHRLVRRSEQPQARQARRRQIAAGPRSGDSAAGDAAAHGDGSVASRLRHAPGRLRHRSTTSRTTRGRLVGVRPHEPEPAQLDEARDRRDRRGATRRPSVALQRVRSSPTRRREAAACAARAEQRQRQRRFARRRTRRGSGRRPRRPRRRGMDGLAGGHGRQLLAGAAAGAR